MSQITVKVPDSVVRQAEDLARRDDIPLDQFVSLALAERISSLLTIEYLEARGRLGSMEKFRELLGRVPAVEPDSSDRIE